MFRDGTLATIPSSAAAEGFNQCRARCCAVRFTAVPLSAVPADHGWYLPVPTPPLVALDGRLEGPRQDVLYLAESTGRYLPSEPLKVQAEPR